MGPELALALAGGGAAAQMIGARKQQKEQRSILNREMQRTNRTQDAATAQVLDEARKFAPEQRMQAMQEAEQGAYDQAQADVGDGAAANIPTASGNVSGDYLKAKADKALSEGNRLTAIAREVARVRAPGQVTTEEGLRRANLTGELGSKWSTTRAKNQAGQMDAQAVDMPWYGQLGKIASAVGSAALMAPSAGMGANFGLAGQGAQLGTPAASGFWNSPGVARIRFG